MGEILGDTTRIGLLELKTRHLQDISSRLERDVREMKQAVKEFRADLNKEKEIPELETPKIKFPTGDMIDSLLYGSVEAANKMREAAAKKARRAEFMDKFVSPETSHGTPVMMTKTEVFTAPAAGWYSINGQPSIAMEADDEHDLTGYSYPVIITPTGSFKDIDPPENRDENHPCCSIDVLLLDEDGHWDVGYYDYNDKKWRYNASPDYSIQPARWEFLPE